MVLGFFFGLGTSKPHLQLMASFQQGLVKRLIPGSKGICPNTHNRLHVALRDSDSLPTV